VKTRCEFRFETVDFEFKKKHTFKGNGKFTPIENTDLEEKEVDFQVEIVPDKDKAANNRRQTGRLHITVNSSKAEA